MPAHNSRAVHSAAGKRWACYTGEPAIKQLDVTGFNAFAAARRISTHWIVTSLRHGDRLLFLLLFPDTSTPEPKSPLVLPGIYLLFGN
jgi:hypothetical protein